MNREALATVVLAVLCVLAVVLASATLSSPVETRASGSGGGSGGGTGGAGGETAGQSSAVADSRGAPLATVGCRDPLDDTWIRVVIVLGIVGLWLSLYRRSSATTATALSAAVGVPVMALYSLLTGCSAASQSSGSSGGEASGGTGGTAAETGGSVADSALQAVPVDLPLAALLVVAAVLVGAVVLVGGERDRLRRTAAALRAEDDAEPDPDQEAAPTELGRVAGRAADRIEAAEDRDNEVYRAWVELTRHLDVDHPESSTPAEFAAAAVGAGLDPDDVDEITRLFEAVRYGGRSATDDRERRAVEALRRIEAEHGDSDDSTRQSVGSDRVDASPGEDDAGGDRR